MSRLTSPEGNLIKCNDCIEKSNCYSSFSCNHITGSIAKLREYEDLEEQEKLLKLPCVTGDSLYIPYSLPRYVKEIKVQNFMYDGCNLHINTDFVTLSIRDIGITAFLTKEEAEAVLKELSTKS